MHKFTLQTLWLLEALGKVLSEIKGLAHYIKWTKPTKKYELLKRNLEHSKGVPLVECTRSHAPLPHIHIQLCR